MEVGMGRWYCRWDGSQLAGMTSRRKDISRVIIKAPEVGV